MKDKGCYQLLKLEKCPEALAFVSELQKNMNPVVDFDPKDKTAKAKYMAKAQFKDSYCKITETTDKHYFILIRMEHFLGRLMGLISATMGAATEKLLKKVGYTGTVESCKDRKYLESYVKENVTATNPRLVE